MKCVYVPRRATQAANAVISSLHKLSHNRIRKCSFTILISLAVILLLSLFLYTVDLYVKGGHSEKNSIVSATDKYKH